MAQSGGKKRIREGRAGGDGPCLVVVKKYPEYIHGDRNNDKRDRIRRQERPCSASTTSTTMLPSPVPDSFTYCASDKYPTVIAQSGG